ncbi:hypothetical protein L6452_25255 [Arctium lappa]|uniref:Uncharacterized protein n=1 Tax=Arctium lappa TaxID=4217 RepID=A0ACB9ABQ5_ARCLA|nr:hypothetical protein L6452_25255 [Arctium lappa]
MKTMGFSGEGGGHGEFLRRRGMVGFFDVEGRGELLQGRKSMKEEEAGSWERPTMGKLGDSEIRCLASQQTTVIRGLTPHISSHLISQSSQKE